MQDHLLNLMMKKMIEEIIMNDIEIFLSDIMQISTIDLYSLEDEILLSFYNRIEEEMDAEEPEYSMEDLNDVHYLLQCELDKRGIYLDSEDA